MNWVKKRNNYPDIIQKLYMQEDLRALHEIGENDTCCRNVTIQVTEDCNCACTYCYQGNKSSKMMSIETGKQIIDMLFSMWYNNKSTGFINQSATKAIILDFIGGEPLLNMKVIDYMCEYFWDRCITENHPWCNTWMASISSNGTLYFDPAFQEFLKKYSGHISYSITVDGPKEIHNSCRLYKNSNLGCFDEAYAALLDYQKRYNIDPGTKVTISNENLVHLNTIAKFFFDNNIYCIYGNVVFEHLWTEEESTEYYFQLKQLADTALEMNHDVYISFFDDGGFCPMNPDIDSSDNHNWCGGTGAMLAFDPEGVAYPCLRYMKSSLGNDQPPIIIGNCHCGIYNTQESIDIKKSLDAITRRTQSTDECYNCSIAKLCSWCSGWNYQENGTPNCRSTRICNSHKARSLANVYFWNKYFIQEGIPKYFHRYLSDDESLRFISKSELDLLNSLEYDAKLKSNECCNAVNF